MDGVAKSESLGSGGGLAHHAHGNVAGTGHDEFSQFQCNAGEAKTPQEMLRDLMREGFDQFIPPPGNEAAL